jgi:hypothetical protein
MAGRKKPSGGRNAGGISDNIDPGLDSLSFLK